MKAVLEFNLPDDSEEYRLANNAHRYARVIWDLQEELRKIYKYGSDDTDIKYAEFWSEKLHDLIVEHDVDLL